MNCASTPRSCGGDAFGAVLFSTKLPKTPRIALPPFRGDPLNVLWMLPISQAEREFAQRHESEALLQRLAGTGCDFVIRKRSPLKL